MQTGLLSEGIMRSSPKPPVRFPLTMGLRYRTKSEHAIVTGTSATKWIGSRQIAFAASEDIQEGMKIQIAIAWPYLLGDRVRLQLIIEAFVTKVAEGIAEAAILQYDFRTRKEQEPSAGASSIALQVKPIPLSQQALAAGASAIP
jgi:hypothetical protein